MTIQNELSTRFYASGDTDLADTFEKAVNLIEVPGTRAANLAKHGRLTPTGVADDVRNFASAKIAPQIRDIRKQVADNRAHLADYRKKLSQPPIDPNDTLGVEYRKEARSLLRGMSNSQRIGALLGESADPLFVAAALEVPNSLSGISADIRAKVEQEYAERTNGQKLRQIQAREDALALIDQATRVASAELQKHARVPEHEFPKWLETAGKAA